MTKGKITAYRQETTQYHLAAKNALYAWFVACFPIFKKVNPNAISRFRIYLAPLLYFLIRQALHQPSFFWFIICLVIIGMFSDGLDGYIAQIIRKGGTRNGKWLDSFADKIFILTIIFSAGLNIIWHTAFWLLFSLELFLMITGAIIAIIGEEKEKKLGIKLGSNSFGKWKFTIEGLTLIILVVYLLIKQSFLNDYLIETQIILFYLVQIGCISSVFLASGSIYGHIINRTPQ